jgi:TPR repeat protein
MASEASTGTPHPPSQSQSQSLSLSVPGQAGGAGQGLSAGATATELIDKVITKSQKLKFVSEEQPKLSLIKENAELTKKINELVSELTAQKDKILSAANSSQQVKKNLETLFQAMDECLDYFEELNNTTVMFITKPKLKRKAVAITQSLRSKVTQLLTSVTLELLLTQGSPETPAPVKKKAALSDDPLTDAQEYCLSYYGLAGRPVNYTRAVELATTAATQEEDPRAMCLLAKCLMNGHGVDADNAAAQSWLEKASELGFIEAKIELAILLLKTMKNRKESCIRKLSDTKDTSSTSSKKPLGGLALVALNVVQQEKERKDDDKMLERATELLIEAADRDYSLADTYLGIISEESGDYEEAAKFFSAGTRRGCADSMNRLGLLHYFGRGLAPSPEKAFALFSSAAQAGNRDAYNNVGICLENGEGVTRSIADALRNYEFGANLGCPDSMYSLGYLYVKRYIVTMQNVLDNGGNNSVTYNNNNINTSNSSRMSAGTPPPFTPQTPYSPYPPATTPYRVGNELSYYDGQQDDSVSPAPRLSSRDREELQSTAKQGIRWLRRASELGIVEATYQLGRVYQQVTTAQGHSFLKNQHDLFVMWDILMQGIGIPTDMNAAFMQFEAAAAQGHANGAELAADMKYSGVGTLQDLVGAANLYRIAAERGRLKAMNALGLLLETGTGTTDRQPQAAEAAKWFLEATRRGSPEAAINIANLLGRMPGLYSFRCVSGDAVTRAQVRTFLNENVTVTAKYSVPFERALKTLDSQLALPPPDIGSGMGIASRGGPHNNENANVNQNTSLMSLTDRNNLSAIGNVNDISSLSGLGLGDTSLPLYDAPNNYSSSNSVNKKATAGAGVGRGQLAVQVSE